MAKVTKRTFSLTEEQGAFIDRKVASGDYASGSEVVREGLRTMQEDEAILDEWLRREVVPVAERLANGTERTYSPEEVREHLRRSYERLAKAAE